MEKTKLAKVLEALGSVTKDKDNPFFKSKYADLNSFIDEIKPALEKNGLYVIQPLTTIEGRPAIATTILDATSDQKVLESITPLPDLQDPQKMGSAITYFRRYALQSLFVMKAEDDDGNSASKEDDVYEQAEDMIKKAKSIDDLTTIDERIKKSDKFTADEKKELQKLIKTRLEEFDPTK